MTGSTDHTFDTLRTPAVGLRREWAGGVIQAEKPGVLIVWSASEEVAEL
jgi:hypothetical protein